ncbi:MAG: hypothetical protein U0R80_04630 [Nocardioidaceae bacterium]
MVAAVYLVLETVLAAVAFSSQQDRPLVEWVAFLLLLPSVVVAFPVIYVGGAVGWSLRDAMPGHPMWPVAVTFAVLMLATAVLNVLVVRTVAARLRRHRGGHP